MSYYDEKNILITGGTGYLGTAVLDALSHCTCSIRVLGRGDKSLPAVSGDKANIEYHKADITDPSFWSENLKNVDTVFHFAAQTSSKVANENPMLDLETNFLPMVAFMDTCQRDNLKPDFISAGTVTQVGVTESWPVDESFDDKPVTIYDINKLAAEQYLEFYSDQMGGRSVTLRLANLYGPGPKSSNADRGVLNMMVRRALAGDPLSVYGDGNFIRDYVYIDDVCEAFLLAGANMDAVSGKHFIIGSGEGHTIKDMITTIQQEVQKRTGKDITVNHVPAPEDLSPIEFRNFVANTQAFEQQTGWKPEVSLVDGIDRTIDFFLKEKSS